MKDFNLIIWITQLGLSVALPPVGFLFLARWLQFCLGWGDWLLWIGIGLGVIVAASGFWSNLKLLKKIAAKKDNDRKPPVVSFNDHD